MNNDIFLDKLDQGIEASKVGAKELIQIISAPLDISSEDKMKSAVESKKVAAVDYFTMVSRVQIETLRYTEKLFKKDRKPHIDDLKMFLHNSYQEGLNALDDCLDILLGAIQKPIELSEIGSERQKSISQAKRIASEDYFFLLDLIVEKTIEKDKIESIGKVVKMKVEQVEEQKEEVVERIKEAGFAESYAQ